MNRLEQAAKPLLTPLIEGTPVALDHEQTAIIAKWIALKCMVAEHSSKGTAVTPKADRVRFRLNGEIPWYFNIYVASHSANTSAFTRHSLCIAMDGVTPKPPLDGTTNNIQTITFYLGRVFVHVNAARVDNFKLEHCALIPSLYGTARVWPFQNYEMVWPRQPAFNVDQINAIATSLDQYIRAQKPIWAGDLPTT
jgi:hypothetical protein